MLGSMDFGHDTFARVVLSKILTSTERDMRLYATRYMRVLLRAKMPFFNSWGIELLVSQVGAGHVTRWGLSCDRVGGSCDQVGLVM